MSRGFAFLAFFGQFAADKRVNADAESVAESLKQADVGEALAGFPLETALVRHAERVGQLRWVICNCLRRLAMTSRFAGCP